VTLRIVEVAGLTDVGRHRQTNEDSYVVSPPLFAVADGMGGARAGEVASRLAVETFAAEPEPDASPERRLREIVRSANRRIHSLSQEDESRAGMGTTLTAALVTDDEVATGHVGDSRLYRFRDGTLERLTTDHSLVEELIRQGKLTPEGAERHPQKSIITRALGPEPDVEVETFTAPARAGDVYLLCSDGLTGMITEAQVAEILRAGPPLERRAHQLIDAANAGGGRDNITVVLFRLGDEGWVDRSADTLSGRETEGGLTADEVRAGLATSDDRHPSPETVVLSRDAVARAHAESGDGAPTSAPGPGVADEPLRRPDAQPPRRAGGASGRSRGARGVRRGLTAVLVLAAVGAVVLAGWSAGRRIYFVGTDANGLVTLYRGLPYEGPLGLRLYTQERQTSVPASSLSSERRESILDHELRSRDDAADLVLQLERGRIR
jgi:PPM family protein phosphatase